MDARKATKKIQKKRSTRVRANIFGIGQKPRLSVHKTNSHVYLQLIDDSIQKTIASVSTLVKKGSKTAASNYVQLGEKMAALAKEKGITKAVFDRGRYRYHGVVKEIAESVRKNGLNL
ncbi:MAG TPA: 50S ribosomal protein L18 [Candidatus Paceibacterota bacterium]|nr:50S ribosomal protein L18 [Candidatus Paceibacterota bacterium]